MWHVSAPHRPCIGHRTGGMNGDPAETVAAPALSGTVADPALISGEV
jgi:hypothetical protein